MRPWPKRIHVKKGARQKAHMKTDGFSSKLEAAVHAYLKRREFLGEIEDIKCQQTIVLQDGARDVRISWRVDFSFHHKARGVTELVEAKGFPTEIYKMKLKLFRKNPLYALEIYGGKYDRLALIERIEAVVK